MKRMSKNARMGTYAFGLSAVALVIVIVVNLIVGQLPTSVTQLDISGNRLYEVSSTTTDLLDSLDKDVELILIGEEGRVDERVVKFTEKYASLSSHLSYSYIDPVAYPSVLETYETSSNTIVVRCEETGRQTIVYGSGFEGYSGAMITYDPNAYMSSQVLQEVNFDGEGQLTAAVNYVTSDITKHVYTLTGHSEAEFPTSLGALIEKAGLTYVAEPVNLLMDGALPEDCDLLIINVPATDLSADELEMLTDYLAGGGDLLMVMDAAGLPNFNTLMETYGLVMQEGFLGDSSRYYSAYASAYGHFCIAPELSAASDITSDITADALLLYPRGMVQVDPARESITVTPFLTTSENGYLFVDENTTSDEGTYIIGAAATEETDGGTAHFTVISSASLISESVTSFWSSMSNLDIFMNAVTANFDGEVANTSIPAKSLSVEYVYVTNPSLWGGLFVLVLPLAALIGGLVYWLRRRKR